MPVQHSSTAPPEHAQPAREEPPTEPLKDIIEWAGLLYYLEVYDLACASGS